MLNDTGLESRTLKDGPRMLPAEAGNYLVGRDGLACQARKKSPTVSLASFGRPEFRARRVRSFPITFWFIYQVVFCHWKDLIPLYPKGLLSRRDCPVFLFGLLTTKLNGTRLLWLTLDPSYPSKATS